MTAGLAALLVVQSAVFALWAFLMFRSLFRLRARAVRRTGQAFPGLGATLESFRAFVTEPVFARDRRQLGGVTLAMAALIGAAPLVMPP